MRWQAIDEPKHDQVAKMQEELGVSFVVAAILVQRGVTDFETAKNFFPPQLGSVT